MNHKMLYENNQKFKHLVSVPKEKDLERFNRESSDFFGIKQVDNPLTFTVKDIFNTYVFPTEMGSPIWKGHVAGNNARVVSSALQAGHKFIAKTVTSEFAVHEPTKVVNPWNSKCQTGTSSAGSAVSVFLKECDYSLATQTAGSISRPASYCGVIGVKPSFGLLPRTGVLKTCDPFDTVGFIVSTTNKIKEIFDNLRVDGKNYPKTTLLDKYYFDRKNHPLRIARIGNNFDKNVEFSNDSLNALNNTCRILDQIQCEIIEAFEWPEFIQDIRESHEKIYCRSLMYYFNTEIKGKGKISNSFKETIKKGESISADDFIQLINEHQINIKKFDKFMKENKIDFIVCPTVYGCAPKLDEVEKPDLNLIWTYLHLPTVTIPMGLDKVNQLPVGVTLVGQKYSDKILFQLVNSLYSNYKIS